MVENVVTCFFGDMV